MFIMQAMSIKPISKTHLVWAFWSPIIVGVFCSIVFLGWLIYFSANIETKMQEVVGVASFLKEFLGSILLFLVLGVLCVAAWIYYFVVVCKSFYRACSCLKLNQEHLPEAKRGQLWDPFISTLLIVLPYINIIMNFFVLPKMPVLGAEICKARKVAYRGPSSQVAYTYSIFLGLNIVISFALSVLDVVMQLGGYTKDNLTFLLPVLGVGLLSAGLGVIGYVLFYVYLRDCNRLTEDLGK